jgi:hypothetical protein
MTAPHYGSSAGTITFPPGETIMSLDIMIADDAIAEEHETLTVTLFDPVNAALGSPSVATLTILDDDLPPPTLLDKIQFKLPGGEFTDIPLEGLYVQTGTTVEFQAVITPPDVNLDPEVEWGGTCGATGTGPTTSVDLSTPSSDMSDIQTITATYGNTVTATIVRYGPDESFLDLDWYDSNQIDVVFKANYKLWVPDSNGDGLPDAPGGTVDLNSIDFDNLVPLINYPTDPPVSVLATWSFNNGEASGDLIVPALIGTILKKWFDPGIGDTIQVAKAIYEKLKQAKVKIVPNDGMDDTNGKDFVQKPYTTSTGQMLNLTLTTTANAWDVPLLGKLNLYVLMEVLSEAKAGVGVDTITTGFKDFYSTPFIAIADRFYKDVAGRNGPLWPKTDQTGGVTWENRIPLHKPPTGTFKFDVKAVLQLTRLGYVYSALNYSTATDPNEVLGNYGVTTRVDYNDAMPVDYGNKTAAGGPNGYRLKSVLVTPDGVLAAQFLQRDYPIVVPTETGWHIWRYDLIDPLTWSPDWLSSKLTINWK